MTPNRPIGGFILRVALWLGPLFLLWYLAAPLLLIPVTNGANFVLSHAFPRAIAAVEQQGATVDIVTRFVIAAQSDASAPPGARGQLVFTLNALKYFYGLPLLLALTVAAPTTVGDKLFRGLVGGLLLLSVPIWGIAAEGLKVLIFDMPPAVATQMGATRLTRDALALAYQMGYLILPAVVPILIWAALHRGFLATLLPQAGRPPSPPPGSD